MLFCRLQDFATILLLSQDQCFASCGHGSQHCSGRAVQLEANLHRELALLSPLSLLDTHVASHVASYNSWILRSWHTWHTWIYLVHLITPKISKTHKCNTNMLALLLFPHLTWAVSKALLPFLLTFCTVFFAATFGGLWRPAFWLLRFAKALAFLQSLLISSSAKILYDGFRFRGAFPALALLLSREQLTREGFWSYSHAQVTGLLVSCKSRCRHCGINWTANLRAVLRLHLMHINVLNVFC